VTPNRPTLRYHGGKWRLAPWVIGQFPKHRVYVEPYGGAASVLLRKPRSGFELYNDLDDEVVNVFRVLRDRDLAAELERLLRLTPFARVEFLEAWEPTADPVERARRTVARSFMGHASGSHNPEAPTGFRAKGVRRGSSAPMDLAGWPDCVRLFTQRLVGVVIESQPALEIISRHDGPAVLFYCDPPYLHSTRVIEYRRTAYRHEMTEAQHIELSKTLRSVRGRVVLSHYDCPLYRELYGDWHRYDKATIADGAAPRVESLWLSPSCRVAVDQCRTLFDPIPDTFEEFESERYSL
jgi:DNA adenine methylase